MTLFWRHKLNAAMSMFMVIPMHKLSHTCPRFKERFERVEHVTAIPGVIPVAKLSRAT